ncbi:MULTISPECIES: TRAP transporter permease [Alkalihalophilus]|uniref:TRAP transporter permease n=1 Tax=Alkalihalophilus TaxID=2893060 RepID=UPI000951A911|nr:TRAP transporter permease [Alkalihalophilus marmarensis]MEC2071529.1 TRAP transporter permease [Alkalihalophilus marmarensis]OLS39563.1 C4-dicarboxylate ABC transporter [Alkalihalophilus pseudofirmus]
MTETTDKNQDLLAKYDKESAYRTDLQKWAWIVTILAISLTIFQLYTSFRGPYVTLIQGAIHLAGGLSLIFILYPAKRSFLKKRGVPWYDGILALLALAVNFYIVFEYSRLTSNQVTILGYSDLDIIVATLGVALVLEATRRAVGLPIVIIALIALLYGYLGNVFPIRAFQHSGFTFDRLMTSMFFNTEAIFGTPIRISSTFIFLFLFFGVMLTKTGIGKFFNDLAFGATGRMTGGTAKAAVTASGLQGMVTGSSVANTVSSGSFTIPMMKRAGFKPEFSAAAEASASTGGQIMPPIMGAAAFIMASNTGVPYREIILIAIIPALLYFAGVFMGTHFEAKKQGILGLPKDQLPTFGGIAKRLDLLAPLITIIVMLYLGFTATTAALWGIGAAFFVSLFRKDTRMGPRDILDALEQGARVALPVIAACASAGIIAGIVTMTGLGGKIAGGIIDLAGGVFFLVLFFTMIACILLGMGLPTTANYVVTASMAAPALVAFDVPIIAAHFFVFYFGIVADITPPVCLAAYAGAGIAKANPMKAGVTAFKLAIAAFIIPYAFVSNPVLLLQDWTFATLIPALITALLGMAAVSASLMNYFVTKPYMIERILLFASGLALIYPNNLVISLSGLGVFVVIAALHILRNRKNDSDKGLATS